MHYMGLCADVYIYIYVLYNHNIYIHITVHLHGTYSEDSCNIVQHLHGIMPVLFWW